MNLVKYIIVLIAAIIIYCGYLAFGEIEYDYNNSPYAYSNPQEAEKYDRFLNQFKQFDPETTVILERSEGFNSIRAFEALDTFQVGLHNLDGVVQISSLQTLVVPEKNAFQAVWSLALPMDDKLFENKFLRIKSSPDIGGKFLSEDDKYLCFYVKDDSLNPNFSKDLDSALATATFIDDYYVLGAGIQNDEAQQAIANESLWISITATFLLVLLFCAFIPSLKRLGIILLITGLNVSLTFILMHLLNIPITVLTGVVPGIIAILSFTDQMHVSHQFNLLTRSNAGLTEVKKRLFTTIGLPLILTSLANLVGFLVFFVNGGVERINDLAIIATLGIILSYLLSRLVLPQLLTAHIKEQKLEQKMNSVIDSIMQGVFKKVNTIIVLFLIVSGCIGYVIFNYSKIDMYYYSHDEDRLKYEEASAVYDQNFQGIRDIEVIIEGETSLFTAEVIGLIDTIENHLITSYGCKSIFSLNTILKRYERYLNGGQPEAYELPTTMNKNYIAEVNEFRTDLGIDALLNEDETCMRIIGSLPDIGTNEGLKRNTALNKFTASLNTWNLEISIGGRAMLFDKGISGLSNTVITLLVCGMLLVSFLISLVFKRFWLGLMAAWVNLLPIGFALFMMVVLHVDINPSSLFMLTILIGVALDDSIYLLGSLKNEKGPITTESLIEKLKHNAFPLLVTSIVIAVAFLALLISSNYITFAFGIIMAASLIFAFLTDIILLPVLLRKIIPKK